MRRVVLGDQFEFALRSAQAGRERGFEALYDEYNVRLVRYLAAKAPGEGEDLAAEVWAAVAERLGRFRGGEREFRSWLFTIAHHRVADHWARRRHSPTAGNHPYQEMAGGDEPERLVVEAAAAQDAARRITEILGADQAEVILLRLLGGLEVEEVAAIMQKRPGTVRVLQHRGLKKLAGEFVPEGVTQ